MNRVAWALALLGLIAAVTLAVWLGDREGPREPRERRAAPDPAGGRVHGTERHMASRRSVPTAAQGAGRIAGRIVDRESGPLAEGRLDVYCVGAVHQGSARIGEDGEFELPACATGPSCLRSIHPGSEQPLAWEIERPTQIELEVEPAPQLSGTIFDPRGEVVANAELLVRRGARDYTSSSDAAGEYAIALPRLRPCDSCDEDRRGCEPDPGRASETASVMASAPSFSPVVLDVELEAAVVLDITLGPPGPALRGRVLGEDGQPFDARTRVLASNVAREQERHAASVDARGGFEFDGLASDAEYSLRAIRDEREIAALARAGPGDVVELRSDLPARGSPLTVEIVTLEGQAITGARVDGGPFWAAISDAEGRVEATDVLPGRYTVRVRAPDCPVIREAIVLEPDVSAWLRRVHLPEDC